MCNLGKRRLVATWFLSSTICLVKLVANIVCVLLEGEIRSYECVKQGDLGSDQEEECVSTTLGHSWYDIYFYHISVH